MTEDILELLSSRFARFADLVLVECCVATVSSASCSSLSTSDEGG